MGRSLGSERPRAAALLRDESGQSTLEYAVVLVGLLGMLVGLAALWRVSREGRLLELAREAASHALAHGIDVKVLQDVTAF